MDTLIHIRSLLKLKSRRTGPHPLPPFPGDAPRGRAGLQQVLIKVEQ